MNVAKRADTRQYVIALTVMVAGSALAWWAVSGVWAVTEQSLLGEAQGSLAQAVSQRSVGASVVTPAAAAMPIVGLAGVAGVLGSRGIVRRFVGILVLIAGVVLVWSGGQAAISLQVGDLLQGETIVSVSRVLPIVAALSGLLLMVGGLAVVVRGNRWPTLGANYERSTHRPRDAWESMDRGIDPTED